MGEIEIWEWGRLMSICTNGNVVDNHDIVSARKKGRKWAEVLAVKHGIQSGRLVKHVSKEGNGMLSSGNDGI